MSQHITEYVARLEKELHEAKQLIYHLEGVLQPTFKEIRLLRERVDALSFSRQPMLRKAPWKNAIDSKVAVVSGVPRVSVRAVAVAGSRC